MPRLEVNGVEWQAAPGPEIRGTTQPPRHCGVRFKMALGVIALGSGQILGARFDAQSAALEDEYLPAASRQPQCRRDTDRARADDNRLGPEPDECRERGGLKDHAMPTLMQWEPIW